MEGPWKTNVEADEWEPMELEGAIVGEVHSLRSEEGDAPYEAGLWRVLGGLPAPFHYDFELDETIHVLEGEVVISVDGRPDARARPGGRRLVRLGVERNLAHRPDALQGALRPQLTSGPASTATSSSRDWYTSSESSRRTRSPWCPDVLIASSYIVTSFGQAVTK